MSFTFISRAKSGPYGWISRAFRVRVFAFPAKSFPPFVSRQKSKQKIGGTEAPRRIRRENLHHASPTNTSHQKFKFHELNKQPKMSVLGKRKNRQKTHAEHINECCRDVQRLLRSFIVSSFTMPRNVQEQIKNFDHSRLYRDEENFFPIDYPTEAPEGMLPSSGFYDWDERERCWVWLATSYPCHVFSSRHE